MSISAKQYQSLQAEACRLAEELPKTQLLDSLVAVYEAGILLHMSKSNLIGLLGSVVLRCVGDQVDEGAPPLPPQPGLWPRVVKAAGYDEGGEVDGYTSRRYPHLQEALPAQPEARQHSIKAIPSSIAFMDLFRAGG
jgi:hypothetical protein